MKNCLCTNLKSIQKQSETKQCTTNSQNRTFKWNVQIIYFQFSFAVPFIQQKFLQHYVTIFPRLMILPLAVGASAQQFYIDLGICTRRVCRRAVRKWRSLNQASRVHCTLHVLHSLQFIQLKKREILYLLMLLWGDSW